MELSLFEADNVLGGKNACFLVKKDCRIWGTYAGFVSPNNKLQILGVTALTNIVDAEDFAAPVGLHLCSHLVAYFVTAIACTVLVS